MKTKRCTKCLETKPLSEYYRNSHSPDGYRPDCKACEGKPARTVTVEERFWEKVERGSGCWEWQAGTATNNGYGRFWVSQERQHEVAHRFAWELVNGEIPDGLHVCHECDNPECVRPDHLFLATGVENSRDAVRKNRHVNKLTPDDVREIRSLLAEGSFSLSEIGDRYGVTPSMIHHIKQGRAWDWLK